MRPHRRHHVFSALLTCSLLVAGQLSARAAEAPPKTPAAAFQKLYNETNLEGWEAHLGQLTDWKADGELLRCAKGTDGWLRTKKVYSDFVLRFEYQLEAAGDSGIGIRVPPAGEVHRTGMEIQLLDDDADLYKKLNTAQYTGSIYWQAAAKRGSAKPAGEWNTLEITCAGQHVKIVSNGQVVNDIQLDQFTEAKSPMTYSALAERPQIGFIALQNHGLEAIFRKIELQDLTTTTATGLQYYDIKVGTGPTVPPKATVKVHYTGRLADGTKFDDHHAGPPAEFPLDAVISGWAEGIPGMKVGGRRKLVIPPQLGYGADTNGNIPGNSTLIFNVEVVGME